MGRSAEDVGPVRKDDPKFDHYPESRFGGFTDSDAVVAFYTRVRALMSPDAVVLDVGCGRGKGALDPIPTRRALRTLRGACAKVIGIDTDPAGTENPMVDEFHQIQPDAPWPVETGSVDVVVSDYVLEHVEDPDMFFAECRRVLKPGGFLCIRTTNAISYFALASRVIPNRGHARVVSRVYVHPRDASDVFPTVYRCNTVWRLRKALRRSGFRGCVYGFQGEPAHFGFSRVLYLVGVIHQRLAPKSIRPALFVFARAV